MSFKLAAGDPFTVNEIPVVRRVVGEKGLDSDVSLFYERADEIAALHNEIKGLTNEGREQEAKQLRAENQGAVSLILAARNVREILSKLRKAKQATEARTDVSPKEQKTKLDEIDEKRREIVDKFNAAYVERVLKPEQKAGNILPWD
jgi:hypothetical protein